MKNKIQNKNKEKEITEEMKELAIARLDVLPEDRKISIGEEKEFTKDELIVHVKKGDEIGKKIIELELEFLRALAQGKLLKELITPPETDYE